MTRRRNEPPRLPVLRLLLPAILLVTLSPGPGAQESRRPAQVTPPTIVTRFAAEGGSAEQLSLIIADSLELTLRLAGVSRVQRADFLTPLHSLPATTRYYGRENADTAVYGAIRSRPAGGFIVDAYVWRGEQDAVDELSQEIESVFGVFDLADELALQIAAEVTGEALAFGTVEIENADVLDSYAVYVDDQLIARNEARLQVLAGERRVTVARPGPLGDQPVRQFQVSVPANETVSLELSPADVGPAGAPDGDGAAGSREDPDPAAPAGPTGTLAVRSLPSGAAVILDGEEIGTTPLEAFGVPAGRYELRISHPLFRVDTRAVEVSPNQRSAVDVELEVNQEHPEVSRALVSPATAGIASASSVAMKAGYLAFAGTGPREERYFDSILDGDRLLPILDMTAIGAIQGGSLVAHESRGQFWTSAAGALSFALPGMTSIVARLAEPPEDTAVLVNNITITALLALNTATTIYDAAFTPAVAQGRNDALLATVRETGAVPPVRTAEQRRVLLEIGAGSAIRAAYVQEIFGPFARLEAGLGADAYGVGIIRPQTEEEPEFLPTATGSLRLGTRPFARYIPGVHPEFSIIGQAETDFSAWGFSLGGGIGSVLTVEAGELVWRAHYLWDYTANAGRFASSIAVGL